MTKKLFSMILALVLLLTALPLAALAEDGTPPAEAGYYYVYTENGRVLNVREDPNGKVVGSLKYGSKIHVDAFVDDNWALILYKYNKPGYGTAEYAAYVNRRFLRKSKPPARKSGAQATPAPAAAADPLEELNAEWKSAKKVDEYEAIIRPTRVSGWVSMHWGPSLDTEIMITFKANDRVLVIAETDNWLQVTDPDKGYVGFIKKNFIAQ